MPKNWEKQYIDNQKVQVATCNENKRDICKYLL